MTEYSTENKQKEIFFSYVTNVDLALNSPDSETMQSVNQLVASTISKLVLAVYTFFLASLFFHFLVICIFHNLMSLCTYK